MKVHILAIAAHPDDVELSAAGTLITHASLGYSIGVVDLTMGEMGTRGTAEQRLQEAEEAGKIMGLSVRENLRLPDTRFENTHETQLRVIQKIRKFRPDVVITNALFDRHPDHGRAAKLVEEAVFKSGLRLLETSDEGGSIQAPWRPGKLFHMIQSTALEPDFLVDISAGFEQKMQAIRAFKTQFFNPSHPSSSEEETYISKPEFMQMIEARAREFGHRIQVAHAEGFQFNQAIGVRDLYHLLS